MQHHLTLCHYHYHWTSFSLFFLSVLVHFWIPKTPNSLSVKMTNIGCMEIDRKPLRTAREQFLAIPGLFDWLIGLVGIFFALPAFMPGLNRPIQKYPWLKTTKLLSTITTGCCWWKVLIHYWQFFNASRPVRYSWYSMALGLFIE